MKAPPRDQPALQVTVTVVDSNGPCDNIEAYDETAVYLGGRQVSFNNVIYESKWWTRGQNPESNSTTWAVWKVIGACGETSAQATAESFSVLYPNPSTNAVTVQTEGSNVTARVVNDRGQEVIGTTEVESGQSLDVSTLAKGIYYVEIYKNGTKEKSSRIVKQ